MELFALDVSVGVKVQSGAHLPPRAELLEASQLLRPKNELISHRCVQEGQRLKQQVLSLRRENGMLDTEVHDKERLVNQLQMKVAVLEQEVKDKEQLMRRTKEVLEAAQQQKVRHIFSRLSKGVQPW